MAVRLIEPNRALRTASSRRVMESRARRSAFIEYIKAGLTIDQALAQSDVNVSRAAYKLWRRDHPEFRAELDTVRVGVDNTVPNFKGNHAQFAAEYFGFAYAPHQMQYVNELESMPLGNILLVLWPPEHGKTTTFENYAGEKLATDPDWRFTVASEGTRISGKILQRVKNRMEPSGPFPKYVRQWGPFKPQTGISVEDQVAQPWTASNFNVFKKATNDERDYSMQALGWKSSIVSTRCDQLHCDDLQSTGSLNATDTIEEWLRQDALSRPGEHGITSIVGTRVGPDDIYERLMDDTELGGILKVIKFKAIRTDALTGEQTALWPQRYNLDQLDRQRRKVGQEAWDRNYMQEPGASGVNATFTDAVIDPCKDPLISLDQDIPQGHIVYLGLDPAIGGENCVIGCEVSPKGKLIIRRIKEQHNLRTNEQIMQELNHVVMSCHTGRVSDVVIETMNFQKGLCRDERLQDMQRHYGFAIREHLTGWNKYDEDVGVPSMVSSFLRGEIVIPWADDKNTRFEMEELIRQLKAWRPHKRGSKLRQDRVMALWFVWILWRSRWKSATAAAPSPDAWKRRTMPWSGTKTGLILPIGARP